MFRAGIRAGIALSLLVAFFYCTLGPVTGQIAPTNSATITGNVSDSTGKPITNANITLTGPKNAVTHTDSQGQFVLVGVPFGTYEISVMANGLGTVARSVTVNGDTNIAIAYEPAALSGLKVIANVRSMTNAQFNITPASVTQVNPIKSAFEGRTSWRTIIEQIPGVAQAGLGAGNAGYGFLPDGPFVPVQISINGALPYETATLLDDMPLIGSSIAIPAAAGSGTNLGMYPLNGFDAADVVRGPGASAPSIVDSIGGSLVLHGPGLVNATHYDLSVSTDPYGGIVANALAAIRWKKLSAVVTYGLNDSPGPVSRANIPAFTSFGSPTTINGAAFSCTGACALTLFPAPTYGNAPFYGFNTGLLVCCYQASSAWSQHSGSIGLHYEFSSSVDADVFYTGQTSRQLDLYPGYAVNFTPPAGYTGGVTAGQQLLLGNSTFLVPNVIQQTSSVLEEKLAARIGSGLLRLAALQNRTFSIPNAYSSPFATTLQLFGGGLVCSNTSPACSTGTFMPTVFNGANYNVTFNSCNLNQVRSSNNRDLLFEYSTPLGENFRAGVSFIQSYYDTPSQGVAIRGTLTGTTVSPSSMPPDISQSTNELRIFVGGSPSARTSIDLSEYFVNANYHVANPVGRSSATGLSSNGWLDPSYTYAAPRLGFVWRPTAAMSVRAAAGGGFAEAPLGYLVGSSSTTPTLGAGFYSITLTNVNLAPEKSFGFDLGTDIRLRHNTVFSFDVYRTRLFGQLYQATSVTGTYLGLPLNATEYGNLGESRYEGMLLDIRHDVPHGLYWALSGGLTRGYVVSVPGDFYNKPGVTCSPAVPANCKNVSVVPGVNFNGTFTGVSVPYSQALGRFGYRWNSDRYVDVVGTYYGNNNTYFRPAFVEVDGHISYPISKNASLLMTFRNITGIYDDAVQDYAVANLIGVPTIAGLPSAEYGQEYGPRTVILTTNVRF